MGQLRQRDIGLPSYGYYASLVLAAVASPSADAAVKTLWRKLGWPDGVFTTFKSTSSLPSAVGVDMGDTVWVGINGTDSVRQVARYANPDSVVCLCRINPKDSQYDFPTVDQVIVPDLPWCNRQFDSWGREVYKLILAAVGNRKPNLILCGHSYGGAVVTAAAGFAGALGGFGNISVTTFGAPKVYGEIINKRLNAVDVCRWMNIGDPVPALPPSEGEIGVPLSITRRIGLALIIPGYKQPKGGKLIRDDGSIVFRNNTQITPTVIEGIIEIYSGDMQAADVTNHYLARYTELLHLAATRLHEFTPATDTELVARGVAVRPAPLFSVRNDMLPPVVSPFVPAAYLPLVQPMGDGWQVNWMNETIMIDASKSRCHTIAKSLKKFLRRSQVSQAMEINSMVDAINAYAVVANAGGNGFRPDLGNWQPG